MGRTPNYGIRYPDMDSPDLVGDITTMMRDIDLVLGRVKDSANNTNRRNGWHVTGGTAGFASGGTAPLSFTTEEWDDNFPEHWVPGTPTVFNIPDGYWLISINARGTAAAGTVNFVAMSAVATGVNLIGQDQLDGLNTNSCWLSITGLIKVPIAGATFSVNCYGVSSGGAAITFDRGRCVGSRIRHL